MIAAALLSAVALVLSPIPASFRPTHLEIRSSWHTFEHPDPRPEGWKPYEYVDITCAYQRVSWRCTGGWIESAWVSRLLDAARIPDEPGHLRLAGYTDRDIQNIAAKLEANVLDNPRWDAAQQSLALRLTTPAAVRAAIARTFGPYYLGANPSVVIRLRDDHHNDVTIESASSGAKMLPWFIMYNERSAWFAHAAISTAVAAFLPPGETNRAQLLQDTPDPTLTLAANIEARVIACIYNDDPADAKFCALLQR